MKLKTVQAQWQAYNDFHFAGKLKSITIRLTRAKKYHGQYVFPDSIKSKVPPYICISGAVNTEDTWRGVLLHEMVHQWLLEQEKITEEEWDFHGPRFMSWADWLGLDMEYIKGIDDNATTNG